jgi:hypothetical protein
VADVLVFLLYIGSLQGFSHRAKYDGQFVGLFWSLELPSFLGIRQVFSFTGSVLILHGGVKVWLLSRASFLIGSSAGFSIRGNI